MKSSFMSFVIRISITRPFYITKTKFRILYVDVYILLIRNSFKVQMKGKHTSKSLTKELSIFFFFFLIRLSSDTNHIKIIQIQRKFHNVGIWVVTNTKIIPVIPEGYVKLPVGVAADVKPLYKCYSNFFLKIRLWMDPNPGSLAWQIRAGRNLTASQGQKKGSWTAKFLKLAYERKN